MTSTEQTMRVLQRAMSKARPRRPRMSLATLLIIGGLSVAAYSAYRDHAEPISGHQLYLLRGMVGQTSTYVQQPPQQVWQRLYDHFDIESPLELRQRHFTPAVEFLAGISGETA